MHYLSFDRLRAVPGVFAVLVLTGAPLAAPTFAQTGAIEEIVVTSSRLRVESLQDAPVAVAVLRGEDLADLNLFSLKDISQIVPSLELNPGRSDTLLIRGIGSGGDTGFDQSVGIVIDDVPFSRGRWLSPGYFDVAQVEVLKGPQGVYLGKNATAGAVYLRSRDPGTERELSFEVGTEFNADEVWGELIASGPITDNLGARLAVRASKMDGWFEQLTKDTPAPEELMARLTVAWDIGDNIRNVTKFTYNDREDAAINVTSQRQSCQGPGGTSQPTFGLLPTPGEDCRLNTRSTLDDEAPPDYGRGRFWDYESWVVTNRLEFDAGAFRFTSITALSNYNTAYLDDYDFVSSPSIYAYEEEENRQFNQEFRVATQWGGSVSALAGIFYEETDFRHRNSSVLFNQAFLDVISGGTIPLVDPPTGRSWLWDRFNEQDGKSWGGFAEVSWEINDRWQLDIGGRYTNVEKDSIGVNDYVHSIVGVAVFPLRAPGDALVDDYDDDNFSPQIILSWRPMDDLMVFTSYTEAFKAGGFAHGSTLFPTSEVSDVTYQAESVEGYNLGVKATLLGSVYLSAVGYYNKFSDLQQSQFNSETTSFTVANAGTNEVWGLDLDATWNIDEHWTLIGSMVFLKSEIDDYIGTCFAGQTVEQGCSIGYDPDTPSGALPFTPGVAQDRSGIRLAPEFEMNLGVRYQTMLGNGGAIGASLFARYRDEVYLQPAREYPTFNDYTRWDATVVYDSPGETWQFRVFGKNLTNEKILTGWVDSPGTGGTNGLPASAPGAGRWADLAGGIQRTREIGITARYRL